MKNLRRASFLLVIMVLLIVVVGITGVWVNSASSEEPRNQVIGVIHIGKIIESVEPLLRAWNEYVAADEEISGRALEMSRYHQMVSQQYQAEVAKLDEKDADYMKKTKEIEDKYNKQLEEAQRTLELEKYSEEFNLKAAAWQEKYEELNEIIAQVAEENGVDVVLNKLPRPDAPILQGVFYGGKDLTDLVIAAAKKKMGEKEGDASTPSSIRNGGSTPK